MTIDISNHPRIKKMTDTAAEARRQASQGPSLFSRVVNEAASKLASGAEAVVDSAYELLPDREDVVGDVGTTSEAILEGAQGVVEGIQNFGTSESRFLFRNFFNAGSTLTEADLNKADIDLLREAVRKAKNEGRSSLGYPDFGTTEGDVLKGNPLTGLFDTDMRMARTMGGVSFSVNDEGETVIENTYNFNEGAKRKAYLEAKREGDLEAALTILAGSVDDPIELASILAYAKQEELRASGEPYETEMVINLGKLE